MQKQSDAMPPLLSAVKRSASSNSKKKPSPFNPLLCNKCQCWNDVGLLCSALMPEDGSSYWHVRFDIPLHTPPDPKCLICDAVFAAANARLAWERDQGRVYPEAIAASHRGPVFVDDHYSCGYRVDYSQSSEFRLWLIIYIEIRREGWGPSMLDIAPRFCLRHSKAVPTQLISVEPWESPFFNIGLLKNWIHTCERNHTDPPLMPIRNGAGMLQFSTTGRSIALQFID